MKYRLLIAALLLPATLSLVMGCTSTLRRVPTDELVRAERGSEAEAVMGVVTLNGDRVPFDDWVVPVADTLHASVDGEPYTIALDQVDEVVVRRKDTATPTALAVVTLVVALVIVAALAVSDLKGGCWGC